MNLLYTYEIPMKDEIKVRGLDTKLMKALVTNIWNRYGGQSGISELPWYEVQQGLPRNGRGVAHFSFTC